MLLVFFSQLHTQQCVWQFRIIVRNLSNIMQQTCAFRHFHIQAKLCRHGSTEVRYFSRVLQQVLPVRRAVPHSSHHPNQLRVQSVNTQVNHCPLPDFYNLVVNQLLGFSHHLFNTCRVNTSVCDQTVQRQARNLPSNRVETG